MVTLAGLFAGKFGFDCAHLQLAATKKIEVFTEFFEASTSTNGSFPFHSIEFQPVNRLGRPHDKVQRATSQQDLAGCCINEQG